MAFFQRRPGAARRGVVAGPPEARGALAEMCFAAALTGPSASCGRGLGARSPSGDGQWGRPTCGHTWGLVSFGGRARCGRRQLVAEVGGPIGLILIRTLTCRRVDLGVVLSDTADFVGAEMLNLADVSPIRASISMCVVSGLAAGADLL